MMAKSSGCRKVRLLAAHLLFLVLVILPLANGQGNSPSITEYELKAAFVYNLLPFVEWPAGTVNDHIVVGFAGEGAMGDALTKMLQGKRHGSLRIEVRQVHNRNDMRGCNVLFIDYREPSRVREALAQVKGVNVLTVSDGESFAQAGGIVALIPFNGKFRIGVNARAADRAHLSVSAKLLSVAKPLADDENMAR